MRQAFLSIVLCMSSLSCIGQAISRDTLTISKQIDEVEIVQQRSSSFVAARDNKLVVNIQDISNMPKFLGTSDPVRYMQSLAGIQTNNETTAGIHIQGCDDYQSIVSINGAPIYYPNHLLGLYSAFIAPHFDKITIEQAEHSGTMENRIGGKVDFETKHAHPSHFGIEGNIGLVSTDLTMAIPCGRKSALYISARGSYLNLLYKRWLKIEDTRLGYNFADANLTYAIHPTEKDEIVFSGFFSRDHIAVADTSQYNVGMKWYNIVGSAYCRHRLSGGQWKTSISYSHFRNHVGVNAMNAVVDASALWSSIDLKSHINYCLIDNLYLSASIDYSQYILRPLSFTQEGLEISLPQVSSLQYAGEGAVGIDLQHTITDWFRYNIGLHGSLYYRTRWFGACDPRVSFHFQVVPDHELSIHGGLYTQYFHKAGLTGGGLPTDFFLPADSCFTPERAVACNLRYSASFLSGKISLQAEAYFKQIYGVVESLGNIMQLINKGFNYQDYLIRGDGRNYGLNLMLQKNSGVLTGYVSYSLGWARRKLPGLDGSRQYIYAASHERRHDLNLVLNARFAKRWNIGAQFVLASGLPYTEAKEAYFLNGQMICRYSTFNGAHMALYNRLDLSCSYDIIKKKDHELGINLSLYNVYCHRNQQFVVYRENLQPIYGTALSIIVPSISIYGKF